MSDSLALFFTTVELIIFFVFDFLFAKVLNSLKQEHPELEECAPEDSPDLDPVAVIESLRQTTSDLYERQAQRFNGARRSDYESVEMNDSSEDISSSRSPIGENALHNFVVVCGLVAPVVSLLQFIFPTLFGWCRFGTPSWIALAAVVPGLAATAIFVSRSLSTATLIDITRQQWISLMWFRLDFMCIMSVVALLGAGAWLVTMCMVAVAFYLAHRVMRIEKRLAYLTRETQLVRGEVDLEHIYQPGSAEAARALASSDVQSYSAMMK